jgi:hypothetical protein
VFKCLAKTSLFFVFISIAMTLLMWLSHYSGLTFAVSASAHKQPVATMPAVQTATPKVQPRPQQDFLLAQNHKVMAASIILHFDDKNLSYRAQQQLEQVLKDRQVNEKTQIVVYAGHTDESGKLYHPHITQLQAQTVARVALAYTRQIKIKLYEYPAKANTVLLEIL